MIQEKLNILTDQVYFIAEIGLNHNGDASLARKMIDLSIESGCSAIKLQKRCIEQMMVSSLLDQSFDRFEGYGKTNREVRENFELSKENYLELRDYCHKKIDFIVTPFDIQSVEFLDDVNVTAYKIAAHSNTDVPMLNEISQRGKPVIVSVGMCNQRELERTIEIFDKVDLTLLYCVSSYPVKHENVHLNMIQFLKQYGLRVGYSDHEDGIFIAPTAVALGAEVIEKHITLDKGMVGFDHKFSLEPDQLESCVKHVNIIKQSLQKKTEKEILPCELKMFDGRRRSIYANCDICKGSVVRRDMLTTKAPLRGLTPHFIDKIVGKKTVYDINKDDPITFGNIDFVEQ